MKFRPHHILFLSLQMYLNIVSRSTLSHDSQEINRRIECRNLKVLCQKCKEESTNTTPLEESGGMVAKGRRKCRCLLYSTMDPIHVENSLSSDSTHEIIKIECINSGKDGAQSPARKVISALVSWYIDATSCDFEFISPSRFLRSF